MHEYLVLISIMPSILLVEDNLDFLDITAELLESEGYTIFTAINGREGFEKACDLQPDLIICDIVMPEWNGLELLQKLKEHPTLHSIPMLLYTAKSEKSDLKKGLDLGACDYIVKPTDIDEFMAAIRKCIKSNPSSA